MGRDCGAELMRGEDPAEDEPRAFLAEVLRGELDRRRNRRDPVALGPVRSGELAMAMGIDASTLTRNLRSLIDAGWLAVGPGDDERSRAVRVMPAGVAKRIEAKRAWKRAQLSFNERLGSEKVARLHALVDECFAALDATAEPD